MDDTACNYCYECTYDDGSCEYDFCLGCMDDTACNYNPGATIDDESCEYPECDDLCETCDLIPGSIYLTNDSELWYNVNQPITGFQFDVYGEEINITGILDGDAQALGFTVLSQNHSESIFSRILGYSVEGNILPPGCGTLLGLQYEGTITNITNIIFATTSGEQIDIIYPECPEE